MQPAGTSGVSGRYTLTSANAATDFQQGELQSTGVNTDLALEGPGFFPVQLPNGSTAYTRDGQFQINSSGELVTKQGYTVQGDGGAIQMDENNPAPLSISADGTVSQGAELKGQLKAVNFNNPNLLTNAGNGYYLAISPQLQTATATANIRQGFLEGSNTSSVTEMANLIDSMRNYEANQKIIQVQDDRMSRVITELGNPNPA
jgi:flagellar basal body rod protein FlgG